MQPRWESYLAGGEKKYGYAIKCSSCSTIFHARRVDAHYCSDRCRQFAHRAPERKLAAKAELQDMGRRANRIAQEYSGSQDMLDELTMLRQALDRAIKRFDVNWQPQQLDLD